MTFRHASVVVMFACLGACASNSPPAPVAGVADPAAAPPADGANDAQQQFIKLARSNSMQDNSGVFTRTH